MSETTHFGDEKTIANISFSDGLEESDNGVITYTVYAATLAEVRADAPTLGSTNANFPSTCVLKKRVFNSASGNTWNVTLTYAPLEPETADGGEANDPEYNLTKSEQSVSILLHPNYEVASDDAKTIAKALIDGADPWEKVYYRVVDGKIEIRKEKPEDGTWTEAVLADMADKVAETDTIGKELLTQIKNGVVVYKSVTYRWTEKIYKSSISTYANNTCKIDTPPGPNPTIDGNWLYLGASASKTRSDRLWAITREWASSDPGATWNENLY